MGAGRQRAPKERQKARTRSARPQEVFAAPGWASMAILPLNRVMHADGVSALKRPDDTMAEETSGRQSRPANEAKGDKWQTAQTAQTAARPHGWNTKGLARGRARPSSARQRQSSSVDLECVCPRAGLVSRPAHLCPFSCRFTSTLPFRHFVISSSCHSSPRHLPPSVLFSLLPFPPFPPPSGHPAAVPASLFPRHNARRAKTQLAANRRPALVRFLTRP